MLSAGCKYIEENDREQTGLRHGIILILADSLKNQYIISSAPWDAPKSFTIAPKLGYELDEEEEDQ
jgi:hypothetical protein